MRAFKLLILFAVSIVSVSTAQAQWPQTTSTSDGRFWMEAGGSVYDRIGGKLGLNLISNSVTNEVLFTSDRLTDMNSAVGPYLRVGSHTRFGLDWEVSTTFAKWDSTYSFDGPDLTSPFIDPTADPNNIGINYNSQIFDLQFNLRKAVLPGMTFLAGPRYFSLSEDMALSTSSLIDIPPFGITNFQTLNNADASNSAIGGTIGMEFNQPFTQNIYFQGNVKASGLANQARLERSSQTTIDQQIIERLDKGSGMFIGQAGGRVYCELIPRTFATYAGYEATWVDGVAVSPSQDFVVGGAPLKTANTIFWHAFTFGARFTY